MEIIKKDDPVTLAKYAVEKGFIDQNLWKWANKYARNTNMHHRIYHNLLKANRNAQRENLQFGVRVPRTAKKAYNFDEINGNN